MAYDGSQGSRQALRAGIELARSLRAEVHTISVMEHLPHYAATVGEVKEAPEEFEAFFHEVEPALLRVSRADPLHHERRVTRRLFLIHVRNAVSQRSLV